MHKCTLVLLLKTPSCFISVPIKDKITRDFIIYACFSYVHCDLLMPHCFYTINRYRYRYRYRSECEFDEITQVICLSLVITGKFFHCQQMCRLSSTQFHTLNLKFELKLRLKL